VNIIGPALLLLLLLPIGPDQQTLTRRKERYCHSLSEISSVDLLQELLLKFFPGECSYSFTIMFNLVQ